MKLKSLLLYSLIFLHIASCGKKEEETIKIGVIAPLTGDGATYGAAMKRGFDLAFETDGKYQLIYEDDKLNPKEGVNAINKLISQDKVQVILGSAASGVTISMVPIADKNKVVLFSSISSSDNLRGMSKYFFRNVPRNEVQGITAAKFLYNSLNKKKMAIIKKNDEYGNNLAKSFRTKITELGGEIIYEDAYLPGTSDFKSAIAKLKNVSVEATYIPGNYQEVAQLLKQAKELKLNCIFMGGDGSYSPELIIIAGKAAEGTYYTQFATKNNEYYKNFEKRFLQKYNRTPDIYDAYAYEAAMILIEAIKSAGYDATKIRRYLLDNSFDSLTGLLKFDNLGDVERDYGILIVKNGKFVEVVQ